MKNWCEKESDCSLISLMYRTAKIDLCDNNGKKALLLHVDWREHKKFAKVALIHPLFSVMQSNASSSKSQEPEEVEW